MAVDYLGPMMSAWLMCVKDHLSKPVGRALVMPGNSVVWDDCCDGQLWVRIISIVGVSNLSNQATQPCNPLYQVRVGIGVLRCAHTVDDAGRIPTPAQMTADAFQTYQDRADMVEAIVCCISPLVEEDHRMGTLRIEDWLPLGVDGGCVGGEITVTVNSILCTPCEEILP